MEQVLKNLETIKVDIDELIIYEKGLTLRGLYLLYEAKGCLNEVKESLTANS